MVKYQMAQRDDELIYSIHNFSINIQTRELFIGPNNNVENEFAEIDHRVADTFIKNICFLNSKNDNPIIVHMYLNGGSWEYGLAIYDVIKTSTSRVYIIVYGQAISMSSVILQAGYRRILSPNTCVTIHEGISEWDGTSKGLIAYAEQMKNDNNTLLDIYIERCKKAKIFKNKTAKQIKNFIQKQLNNNQEWYLSSLDAVKYGFADYILDKTHYATILNIIQTNKAHKQ